MLIFGLFMFGYESYIYCFMISILVITRGAMTHVYTHQYLQEDYEYYITRVGIIFTMLFIFGFHFVVRYFVINLSIASFLSEFTLTRKELHEQRMKREMKKLEIIENERLEKEIEEKKLYA